METSLAVVVLAAGAGTRMKSALPKVLHPLAGWPMIRHVLGNVGKLRPACVIGVIAPGSKAVAQAFSPHPTVIQAKPLGTGHAAKAALTALKGHVGPVLVVFGDAPLVTAVSMKRLVAACARKKASVGVLGFRARDPSPYGRLVVGSDGGLEKIVESRDCSNEESRIDLCNSGVMCIDGTRLAGLLGALCNANAKREFYLTEVVALARAEGLHAIAIEGDEEEFQGINSRAELAAAEGALQRRLRAAAFEAGVSMIAPDTVWLSADTRLSADVSIGPNVRIGPGVSIASDVEIKGFCDIEGARIGRGAIIGPFARIRPGSRIGENAHIGNFVELKATIMGQGAKANHLAYLGDADIGAGSNIGAGTIFVNYDGFGKYRSSVGVDAFIGSNSSLVAPLRIGRGANVTAGSVITEDVPADGVAFGRARQITKGGRAAALRAKLTARAAAAERGKK